MAVRPGVLESAGRSIFSDNHPPTTDGTIASTTVSELGAYRCHGGDDPRAWRPLRRKADLTNVATQNQKRNQPMLATTQPKGVKNPDAGGSRIIFGPKDSKCPKIVLVKP